MKLARLAMTIHLMVMKRELIAVAQCVMPARIVLMGSKTGMKKELIVEGHFAHPVRHALITFKMEMRQELIVEKLLAVLFVVSKVLKVNSLSF